MQTNACECKLKSMRDVTAVGDAKKAESEMHTLRFPRNRNAKYSAEINRMEKSAQKIGLKRLNY